MKIITKKSKIISILILIVFILLQSLMIPDFSRAGADEFLNSGKDRKECPGTLAPKIYINIEQINRMFNEFIKRQELRNQISKPGEEVFDPIMAGIIHDLKNKLASSGGFANLIIRKYPEEEKFSEIGDIKKYIEIVTQLEKDVPAYLTNKIGLEEFLNRLSDYLSELEKVSMTVQSIIEEKKYNSDENKKLASYLLGVAKGLELLISNINKAINWSGRSTESIDDLEKIIADVVKGSKADPFISKDIEFKIIPSEGIKALKGKVFLFEDKLFTYKGIIEMVIAELLKNASKYSGTKKIDISISLSPDRSHIEIKVKDYGKGIKPEILEWLGRSKVSEATDTKIGTGLGIYTLKATIESVGGRLDFKNNEAEPGSTFSFTLPLVTTLEVIAKPRLENPIVVAVSGLGGSGKRVTSVWLAAKLGLRTINAGFLMRVLVYKLLEDNIDFNDQKAVTEYVRKFLQENRIDYSTEPIKVDGVDTAEPGEDVIALRDKIKAAIDKNPENIKLFDKISGYEGVKTELEEFLLILASKIKASGKYNGVVIRVTEPLEKAGIINIMLDAPLAIRANRLRHKPEAIEERDMTTNRKDLPAKYSWIKKIDTYDKEKSKDILVEDVGKQIIEYIRNLFEQGKKNEEEVGGSLVPREEIPNITFIDKAI